MSARRVRSPATGTAYLAFFQVRAMTAYTIVECLDLGETVDDICFNYSLEPDMVLSIMLTSAIGL